MLIKRKKHGRKSKNQPKKKQTDILVEQSPKRKAAMMDYDDELELMNDRFSRAKLQSSEKKPPF